jgi:hypothetical protein
MNSIAQLLRVPNMIEAVMFDVDEQLSNQLFTAYRQFDPEHYTSVTASIFGDIRLPSIKNIRFDGDETERQTFASIADTYFAWREHKTIYDIDSRLMDALVSTAIPDSFSSDILEQLPLNCPYIALPRNDLNVIGLFITPITAASPVHGRGYLILIAYDAEDGMTDLESRYVVVKSDISFVGMLDRASSDKPYAGHGDYIAESTSYAIIGTDEDAVASDDLTSLIAPILLYVCSADIDIEPRATRDSRRARQRKRMGLVDPQVFDIGYRIGATIHSLRNIEEADGWDEALESGGHIPTGQTKRPHIRRAHWHTYWIGRRSHPSERKRIIKWIAPTIVNENELDELLPTIRRLK